MSGGLAFSENDPRLAPLLDVAAFHNITLVVGAPVRLGLSLCIGAFILSPNRSIEIYTKHHSGAFPPSASCDSCDGTLPPGEAAVFQPGDRNPLILLSDHVGALAICADVGTRLAYYITRSGVSRIGRQRIICLNRRTAVAPKLFRVILQVCDIDRATSFYEAVLAIKGKRVSPGRHYFQCDGTILACFNPQADADDFEPRANVDYVYIAVDDVDATFRAAKSAGATFAAGDVHGAPAGRVATRPWGERSFYVEDPFGNKLCFVDRATMFTG